mmetsp:Transcript_43532/g.94506  ORF Transcript_43532/g.94506 Transcript_43532/m.94506 type:complete len:181 (+) Transcript_43532:376-918(+)
MGLGSAAMMAGALAACRRRPHIAVDPYDAGVYATTEDFVSSTSSYGLSVKLNALLALYSWASPRRVDFSIMQMTSEQFFRHVDGVGGVSVWDKAEVAQLDNLFSMVHIDGQHALEFVMMETKWFLPKLSCGAVIVFDDCDGYDHGVVEEWMFAHPRVTIKEIVGVTSWTRGARKAYVRQC